jgi:hypothetical protein
MVFDGRDMVVNDVLVVRDIDQVVVNRGEMVTNEDQPIEQAVKGPLGEGGDIGFWSRLVVKVVLGGPRALRLCRR